MRWLSGAFGALVLGTLVAACSAGGQAPAPGPDENVGDVAQAITAACNTDTIGLPCDPDGPAGAKLECEGVCAINQSGIVTCASVAAGTLNGVVCGTTTGVGDAACKRYCSGKTCLGAAAPLGAACRPTNKSNPCEGQCDGAGKCTNLGGEACDFGRDEQLCKFATCNFANATQCLTKNLTRNTLCSDADACSIGKCNPVGVCVAGPTVGCDDGNACTDDACDPDDGGCVGVNDDSNDCTDGNACFTGEHCSSGSCVPGTIPVNCEDNNACTADTCDPNTGCAHIEKSCSDGDACTTDSCDPTNGACTQAPVACSDADPCTIDSCDSVKGCVFQPLSCDDGNACTADSCAQGSCGHELISCDDGDPCTADSCDTGSGCGHAAIAGCGAGGAGGQDAGGAGGDTSTAGSGGTAGTSGDAGAGPTDGGEPTVGGAPSEAGAPAQAGTSQGGTTAGSGGNATSGTAGTSAGGIAAGGATAGGPSGGMATGASAGAVATGGDVAQAGAADGGTQGQSSGDSSSSCSCRTAGGASSGSLGGIAAGLMGLTLLGRRRQKSTASVR